jgi:hypothetical protein
MAGRAFVHRVRIDGSARGIECCYRTVKFGDRGWHVANRQQIAYLLYRGAVTYNRTAQLD